MTSVQEANKAGIRRAVAEMLNPGDFSRISEFMHDDVVLHALIGDEEVRGHDAFIAFYQRLRAGFPDLEVTLEEMVAEGDRVACRLTMRGTHLGEFNGFPPTGRRFEVAEFIHERWEDGRARELWALPDLTGLLQQLGVVPKGPPPKVLLKLMLFAQRFRRGDKEAAA